MKSPKYSELIGKYGIGELKIPIWKIDIPKSEDSVRKVDPMHIEKVRDDILKGGIKLSTESGILLLKNCNGM
jgi:hypothetical protein